MERLVDILVAKNIHPSHQRLKILDILLNSMEHPSVNYIYERLSKEMPVISKATIYNTLKTFVEKGLVNTLTITPEETRYDYNRMPHHHLLCRVCGRVLDVDVQCIYAEENEIAGHRIEEIHGYFKGICKDCIDKVNGKDH